MSFLSLNSLFGSSLSRGESVSNDNDQEVERDSGEIDLNLSFSTNTHDDHDGSAISSGWQEIVPFGSRTCIPRRDDYGEEEESLSGTIVSSAPTTVSDISPQEQRESRPHTPVVPLALSPDHLQFRDDCHQSNALSITTTESVYRNWQSLLDDDSMNGSSDDQTVMSVLDMSLVDTLSSVPTLHSSLSYRHDQLDGISFRNVADRLVLLSQSGGGEKCCWYSHFTEQDWMQFQQVANMVLNALMPDDVNVTNGGFHSHNRRDFLLAEWIQQEEDYFEESTSTNLLLFLGERAMYVALASLWAVGVSVLSRR